LSTLEAGGVSATIGKVGLGLGIDLDAPSPGTWRWRGNVGVAATIPISGTLATLNAAGSVDLGAAASFMETALVRASAFGGLFNESSGWSAIVLEAPE